MMQTRTQKQLVFWGIAIAAFVGFILLFKSILLPFILGITLAYLINPIILKLKKWGIPRSTSSVLLIGIFFIAFVIAGVFLVPIIIREASDLIQNIPEYYERLSLLIREQIANLQPLIHRITGSDAPLELKALLDGGDREKNIKIVQKLFTGLTNSSRAVFDILSVTFLTPVVAYFMIKEWPGVTNSIEEFVPHDHRKTAHKLWDDIDSKLAGFVRGQVTVAFFLSIAYALALSTAGLKYGVLIGLLSGALSIIPLFGSIVGLACSVLVAWFQMGTVSYVGLIAGIFLLGQVIEGNFLTPKLVGDSVGLHPLWVFFSLMAGGSLFGLVGMLIAVPIAAILSVLLHFAIARYKASMLYQPKAESSNNQQPLMTSDET